ncbi:MAG TPA: hypothetical protein VFW42_10815 [Fluviicoccus sp.]|nr:hypothetical protein [Fluviicoccus sp.]
MVTQAEERFVEALGDLIKEDVVNALAVLTGAFVGLTVEMVSRQGHVSTGDITIQGGNERDITIHAEKSPSANIAGV